MVLSAYGGTSLEKGHNLSYLGKATMPEITTSSKAEKPLKVPSTSQKTPPFSPAAWLRASWTRPPEPSLRSSTFGTGLRTLGKPRIRASSNVLPQIYHALPYHPWGGNESTKEFQRGPLCRSELCGGIRSEWRHRPRGRAPQYSLEQGWRRSEVLACVWVNVGFWVFFPRVSFRGCVLQWEDQFLICDWGNGVDSVCFCRVEHSVMVSNNVNFILHCGK